MLFVFKEFNDYLMKTDGISHRFKIETASSTHSNYGYILSEYFTGAIYFIYDDKFSIAVCFTPPESNNTPIVAFGITWKRMEKYLEINGIELESMIFYEKNKEILATTLDLQELFKKWVTSYFEK